MPHRRPFGTIISRSPCFLGNLSFPPCCFAARPYLQVGGVPHPSLAQGPLLAVTRRLAEPGSDSEYGSRRPGSDLSPAWWTRCSAAAQQDSRSTAGVSEAWFRVWGRDVRGRWIMMRCSRTRTAWPTVAEAEGTPVLLMVTEPTSSVPRSIPGLTAVCDHRRSAMLCWLPGACRYPARPEQHGAGVQRSAAGQSLWGHSGGAAIHSDKGQVQRPLACSNQ
jgi:hypothetical protein